jgi:glycosyltransferase involved in cell wall biosynthesis
VINQTYSNLEIILVNDGSSDETFNLCNELAKQDNRIIVIHKEKEGSSYARKTGVENATAEFITFVDADDIILPQMYKNMIEAMILEKVDIAQCGVKDGYENGEIKHRRYETYDKSYKTYNKIEGVLKILEDKEWCSYMWNKIYKHSLFDNIIFPNNRGLDDDTTVMHHIFHNAQNSIYFNDEYYCYLQRPTSITRNNSIWSKMKNIKDRCDARYERYLFVLEHPEYLQMQKYCKNIAISVGIAGLRTIINYPDFFPDDYFNKLSHKILSIPFHQKEMTKEYFSVKKRIEYQILRLNPNLYRQVIKLVEFKSVLRLF